MKKHFLILLVLLSTSALAQTPLETKKDSDIFIYPILKEVNNYFDVSFLEKLYKKNLTEFQNNKNTVIEKLSEKPYIKDRLKVNPNYFKVDVENDFTNPHQVNNYFKAFNLTVDIDGVSFKAMDTSTYRQIYEHQKKQMNTTPKETTISWNLHEFKAIPLSKHFNSLINAESVVSKQELLEGEYVMLYEPIYDRKKKLFLIEKPYCFFKIKNSKLHGNAVFFTPNGDTLATGKYDNGMQEGSWIIRLPYYAQENSIDINFGKALPNGEVLPFNPAKNKDFGWCTYIVEFQDGKPSGEFVFKQNESVRTTGFIKNTKPIGNWRIYHKNGQLANSFTFNSVPLRVNQPSLYPKVANIAVLDKDKSKPFEPFPHYINTLPIGNYTSSILGLSNSYFIDERYVFDDDLTTYTDDIQFYNFIDSTNMHEYYIKDDFEAYFENGQLYFKMHINETGEITEFSDVFDIHGNLIIEWQLNKDRTEAKVIKYNENGDVVSVHKTLIIKGKQVWEKLK